MPERELTSLITPDTAWMLFIDGENLTKRGQDVMAIAGVDIVRGEAWRRDVYLWMPRRDPLRPDLSTWRRTPMLGFGGGGERPVAPQAVRAH